VRENTKRKPPFSWTKRGFSPSPARSTVAPSPATCKLASSTGSSEASCTVMPEAPPTRRKPKGASNAFTVSTPATTRPSSWRTGPGKLTSSPSTTAREPPGVKCTSW